MNRYEIQTWAGIREWLADDENHAIEQHYDAFPEESIQAVTMVEEDVGCAMSASNDRLGKHNEEANERPNPDCAICVDEDGPVIEDDCGCRFSSTMTLDQCEDHL